MKRLSKFMILNTLILFISCQSKIETECVGNYFSKNEKATQMLNIDLTISDDNTFLLKYKQSTIKGKWQIKELDDFTVLTLINGTKEYECLYGTKSLKVLNPHLLLDNDSIKSLVLYKK